MDEISCVRQECARMILLLDEEKKLGNTSYTLSNTEGYLVEEYLSEIECYLHQYDIQLIKKYKKTETGKMSVYTLS